MTQSGTHTTPTSELEQRSFIGEIRDYRLTPLAAAVVFALNPSQQAAAQDDDDGSAALDEVIVTATKRAINLQDVAQSIDVVSATDLQRMGAKDMEATLKALPSVALTALQPGQNSLVVRGISTGPFEYRTEAQVAVYVDEQPFTFNSQQVGIRNIDLQRVENLPGPQGTLFGSSSQTGTIRYITNKPNTDGFDGSIEARYATTKGGDASYDLNGFLNIPVTDNFAIRAVGYTSHDGGYVDNVLGTSLAGNYDNADKVEDNYNTYDVVGGRLQALWDISDKWSILLTGFGENTAAEGRWATDAALGDFEITRFEDEFRDDDWLALAFTLRGDLGFADLTFSANTFTRDIAYEYDNMTYSQSKDRVYGGGLYRELYYAGDPNYVYYSNYGLYDTEYNRALIFNDQEQTRQSFELRLTSSGDSRFKWMVGAFHEDITDEWFYGSRVENLTDTRAWSYAQSYAYFYANPHYINYTYYDGNPYQAYPMAASDIGYSNTLDRSIKQTAFFGEISFDLTDKLTVHGGARYAEYDRDIYSRFQFPEGLNPIGDRSTGDGSFRDIGKVDDSLFKVGLKYNIDDDRMVYGLFSQGFRVGGFNSPRAAATGQVPREYGADFLDNYELGIKSQWFDNRVTLNAALFLMEWKDYQQGASFDRWWLRGTLNAEGAETQGFEVQVEWQATDNLTLSANLFMADPEFTDDWCNDYVDGVQQPCPTLPDGSVDPDELDIVAGMTMPNSPKTTAFASIFYNVPDVFNGSWWFYYDISYSGEIWNNIDSIRDNDREGLAPSWTYSSFSTGLSLPNRWDVEVNVRNLFDQKGFSYIWQGEADSATDFNDPRFQQVRALDRPRTIWLTVRKGFGGG